MLSGHTPTRPSRRLATALGGAGLVALLLAGCSRDQYDEGLTYPVRTDWVINQQNTWEQQPSRFNSPGLLPLDAIRLPDRELTPDLIALKSEIGKKLYDPAALPGDVRQQYAKELNDMFGTPAHPKVGGLVADALKKAGESVSPAVENLTAEKVVADLQLEEATLAEGSRLYRRHCLHCHGLEGNGRGATGYWVNPHPRDYRLGIFKFTSSNQDQNARKPRRADLLHVLQTGIEGTSMPSFAMLPHSDLEKLASYVIHLSLRGEAENSVMLDQLRQIEESKGKESAGSAEAPKFVTVLRDELQNPTLRQALEDYLALAAGRWVAAQKPEAAIQPEKYPYPDTEEAFLQSAARGGRIFLGPGGCISCHQNYGRESNLTYDSWGTIVRGRNLYDGIYRGGRRPLDLYYRVHGGINGAGMTSYKDIKALLEPDKIGVTADELAKSDPLWDLVNFMRATAYADLRAKLKEKPYSIAMPD